MAILKCIADIERSRPVFEQLYADFNKREFVSPDPLQFLYSYSDVRDREVVALIAASLAYGRVAQILKSVERVLLLLGKHPAVYLANCCVKELRESFKGFVHRFTDEDAIVAFLSAMGKVYRTGGNLETLFCSHYNGDIWAALENFTAELSQGRELFLLPRPSKGSACKRLALFLRWMVRNDEVDPGGWSGIKPDALFVPLDTHIFQICTELGLCTRRAADGKTAREITENFRIISPLDPVKYDFSLTRFGIRSEMSYGELFENFRG